MNELKKTPLYREHEKLGATFENHFGWLMPAYYTTPEEEHRSVRNGVGLFDISHVSEIHLDGPGTDEFIDRLVTGNVKNLSRGHMLYTFVLNEQGGIIDDVLLFKRERQDTCMLKTSAEGGALLRDWIAERAPKGVRIRNISESTIILSLQGPRSPEVMERVLNKSVSDLEYYQFREEELLGGKGAVARTGYSGEVGYELYVRDHAPDALWRALLYHGITLGIQPVGFRARNTLRLEMGYSLNGLDFNANNTPLEIDAESLVDFDKEFIGKEALLRQRKEGIQKKLAGLVFTGDKPAPAGAVITAPHGAGKLTSCLRCPTVGKTLGLGFVPAADFVPGTTVSVKTTGGEWTASVTVVPFYKQGTFKKCLE